MWKKVKRILSCILALILLLSLIDGQQFFVRAESEVKATQTEQESNKMEETETSSGKEEGSEEWQTRRRNTKGRTIYKGNRKNNGNEK